MQLPIPDRKTAGLWLAELLIKEHVIHHPIVLALPRGGVPVAAEIAYSYQAPLDILLVRKLGVPVFPELAMGAIASGDIRVLNNQVIQSYHINQTELAEVETKERKELNRREATYRGDRPLLDLQNRNIILVDDGLATGSTMLAAIDAIKQQSPKSITVAIPVAPASAIGILQHKVDHVICPFTPELFSSIGEWYLDFSQVSDQEVIQQLNQAWQNA